MSTSHVGIRLCEERKRIGLSQLSAGLIAGVSREQWGRYERGSMPNAVVLVALIGQGFDVNYILGGARTLSESTLGEAEELVLHCYRCTDDEGRASIERLARMEAARVTQVRTDVAAPDKGDEPKPKRASH